MPVNLPPPASALQDPRTSHYERVEMSKLQDELRLRALDYQGLTRDCLLGITIRAVYDPVQDVTIMPYKSIPGHRYPAEAMDHIVPSSQIPDLPFDHYSSAVNQASRHPYCSQVRPDHSLDIRQILSTQSFTLRDLVRHHSRQSPPVPPKEPLSQRHQRGFITNHRWPEGVSSAQIFKRNTSISSHGSRSRNAVGSLRAALRVVLHRRASDSRLRDSDL